jgi:hypothetical protein
MSTWPTTLKSEHMQEIKRNETAPESPQESKPADGQQVQCGPNAPQCGNPDAVCRGRDPQSEKVEEHDGKADQ